jgi:hypothetical protein
MTRRPLLLLLAVAGCATAAPAPQQPGPLLDPPLPPASLGRELAQSELLTGDFGGRSMRLRVEFEVTAERLVVVGLSLAGLPLFTLEQTVAGISVAGAGVGRLPFDPAYMLADLQLVHWPAAALAPALATRGLALEEQAGRRRVLDQDGRPLVEIVYDDPAGVTRLRHLDHPYSLSIEILDGAIG